MHGGEMIFRAFVQLQEEEEGKRTNLKLQSTVCAFCAETRTSPPPPHNAETLWDDFPAPSASFSHCTKRLQHEQN